MRTFKKYSRQFSTILLLSFIIQILAPTTAMALTGGPSQPEVQSFEPIGTTQMVDAFSGDFNYNIPLLEIDGYPINISYHSGITTDQEASWVGLGWNLNPGVVNRNMRGLPDDFDGDLVEKETEMKPDATIGINLGAGMELLGKPKKGRNTQVVSKFAKKLGANEVSLSMNMGVNFNNYRGVGFDFGLVPSIGFGNHIKSNYSLAMNYSSQGGATVSPKIGLGYQTDNKSGNDLGSSIGGGFNINSRQGLKDINLSTNASFNKTLKGENGHEMMVSNSAGMNFSANSFASSSYTPQIKHSMNSYNVGFTFNVGVELKPVYLNFSTGGTYAKQSLGTNGKSNKSNKSYGSLYLENSISGGDEVLLDFNREKDGSFSKENPTLAIPQQTFDLYSYSGQGIGGMFRTFRSDLPIFSDPENTSLSNNSNIGGDIGLGDLFKAGASLTYNRSESRSGAWKNNGSNGNSVLIDLGFGYSKRDIANDPFYEPAYFKNIGEKSEANVNYLPYDYLTEVPKIDIITPYNNNSKIRTNNRVKVGSNLVTMNMPVKAKRPQRDKRNVFIRSRKGADAQFCLDQGISNTTGFGTQGYSTALINRVDEKRKAHHTSELTVINPDGNKYVYGIAAYNTEQTEYSFTYAKDIGATSGPSADCAKGEIEYNNAGITTTGTRVNKGIDYYFDRTKTPAYAHSYLLTHILSNDYVDIGNDGVGSNDLGTYVNINYSRVHAEYNWRVPYGSNRANFNEGLKSDKYDDNANFVFGKKEIWHVHSIEGRNQIAVFFISPRKDALGVTGVDGGRDLTMESYKLDSIKLFSLNDLINPIKSVFFEYDYALCPQVPNNKNFNPSSPSSTETGKLTLKKIYFTYGNSIKGKYNSYKFDYSSVNPTYNLKAYDRWGNYKPEKQNVGSDNSSNGVCDSRSILLSKDFPYVDQNKTTADQYAQAWTLTKITLPSGGEIAVTYESDDYAYVQNKVATQMYRLLGASYDLNGYSDNLYESNTNFNYLFFEVNQAITDEENFKAKIIKDLTDLYFNVLVDLDNNGTTEYIRGYAKPIDAGLKTINNKNVGWIKIAESDISDIGKVEVNAISLAAWNFTNLYVPQLIYPGSNTIKSELSNSGKVKEFAKSLYGFFPEMYNLIRGVNKKLRNKEYARKFIPEKSWIKANNVTGYKFGGGCRVKRIVSIDKWKSMEESNNVDDFEIGQEYSYEIKTGSDSQGNPITISSGVASYEPMAGGDENPFRKPVYYDQKQLLIPDVSMYSEEPFGEAYFPSPSVGYSRVTIKTISSATNEELSRNGSGKIVNEFYTTKDFPTIVQAPQMDMDEQNPNMIFSLIFKNIHKSLTMTQGYQITLNDMNGKQKGQWNFDQKHVNDYDVENAYSGVKYEYFEKFEGGRKLNNRIRVIKPDNTIGEALIGVESDVIADSRQFNTENFSGGINLNLDVFKVGLIPIPVPTGIPSFEREVTDFQSGVIVRIINTYGILKSTTAFEEGASLRTENTLFDAETGEVIMTKTQNEFEDYIYNTTYPAHWVYDGMRGAYKNDGLEINIVGSSSPACSFKAKVGNVEYTPENYFSQGDFLEVKMNGVNIEPEGVWVHKSDNNKWRLIDKSGNLISLNPSVNYTVRVIATGRKNMAISPVASISSLKNHSINTNNKLQYSNSIQDSILSVSVNEYDQNWQKNGCYGFGVKKDTIELLQDAVDIFNFLFEEGTISMANAADNNNLNLWHPVNKKEYSPDFGYPASTKYSNSAIKALRTKYGLGDFSTITSYQTKRHGSTSTNFEFNFDFAPFEINTSNTYVACWMAASIHFSGNPPENNVLAGKTIDHISVDFNQIPFDHYYFQNSSPNFPVSKFYGAATIYFTDNTSKEGTIDILSSYYREKTSYGLELETVNPYITGLRNNWKPKRQWAYVSDRSPQNGSGNIRKDGYFNDFQNFWASNTTGWEKQASLTNKWQFTKETTKYGQTGTEIESRNPLNIYNSSIIDEYSKLPIAVANNAKQNQIYFQGFEYSPYYYNTSNEAKCPASHSMIDPLSGLIDTVFMHSGVNSYKVPENTRLLKTYTYNSTESLTPIDEEFVTSPSDYITPFIPTTGQYIISGWVKVGNAFSTTNYSNAKIRVVKSTSNTINDTGTPSSGTYYDFTAVGPIIDGWQRIEGQFEINSNTQMMSIRLIPDPSQVTYFDDIRVFPADAIMKSYVYETRQFKIWAELDENNYATFYEYDKGGNLIRVKKETERGIMTIKDTRNSLKKTN